MPENALAGGEEDIWGNKPADFGVIVPALEVVEAGFLIIDIPTVTEGIILSECGSERALCWQQFAPTVIAIFYNSAAAVVNEFDDAVMRIDAGAKNAQIY